MINTLDGLNAATLLCVGNTRCSVTGVGVDLRDFIGTVKVIANAHPPSADDGTTTATLSLKGSDDNSTWVTFAAAPTFAAITGTGTVQERILDTRAAPRYVAGVLIMTAATAANMMGVYMALVGSKGQRA